MPGPRDYRDSDIKRLFAFSGNQCSHPNCNRPVIASDGITVVGKICHIEAASPKGPRYSEEMTDDERRSFNNLILLCDEHHSIIDNKRNEERFPKELLIEWKTKHVEKNQNSELEVNDKIIESAISTLGHSLNRLESNTNRILEELTKFKTQPKRVIKWQHLLLSILVGVAGFFVIRYILILNEDEHIFGKVITPQKTISPNHEVFIKIFEKNGNEQARLVYTDSLGDFKFPVNSDDIDSLKLVANGIHVGDTLTLNDFPRDLTKLVVLKEGKGEIPLSIKYLTVSGQAIDIYLDSLFSGKTETLLKGALSVKNNVYNDVVKLRNNFNYNAAPDYYMLQIHSNSDTIYDEYGSLNGDLINSGFDSDGAYKYDYKVTKYLYANSNFHYDLQFVTDDIELERELKKLGGWQNEEFQDTELNTETNYILYQYFDQQSLSRINSIIKSFFKREVKLNSNPDDEYNGYLELVKDKRKNFIDVLNFNSFLTKNAKDCKTLRLHISNAENCAEGILLTLNLPSKKLKLLFLENNTKETLSIGEFYGKYYSYDGLFKKENYTSQPFNTINRNLISLDYIKPGEKVLLPLYFYYEWELDEYESFKNIEIPKEEFIYQHLYKIDSINIANVNYSIRDEYQQTIQVGMGLEAGSCPYVYTKNDDGDWLVENHILYGFNTEEKENDHQLKLKRFTGQIMIKENDPETSFIDYIAIKHIDSNGRETIFEADNFYLEKIDSNYLQMEQGDDILLNFTGTESIKNGTFYIISRGYYIPYDKQSH